MTFDTTVKHERNVLCDRKEFVLFSIESIVFLCCYSFLNMDSYSLREVLIISHAHIDCILYSSHVILVFLCVALYHSCLFRLRTLNLNL